MPRPSNDVLIKRLGQCSYRLGVLSTDPEWNITAHRALPFALEDQAEFARWVVLVRFHYPLFSDKINESIRRVVNLRAPQALIRVRWNEHEALFVLSERPEQFIDGPREGIRPFMRNEKLNFSLSFVPFSGSIEYDHDRAVAAMFPVLVEE